MSNETIETSPFDAVKVIAGAEKRLKEIISEISNQKRLQANAAEKIRALYEERDQVQRIASALKPRTRKPRSKV